MPRVISFCFVLFMILTGIYATSVNSTDFKAVYDQFLTTSKFDLENTKATRVNLTRFPRPAMNIDFVTQPGKMELKNIKISFWPLSFIMFEPKISKVQIEKAKIFLSRDEANLANHDELIAELIQKEGYTVDVIIDELEFIESDGDIPFRLSNFRFKNDLKESNFTGRLENFGLVEGGIAFNEDSGENEFALKLDSPDYVVEINESFKDGILSDGDFTYVSSELPKTIIRYFPDLEDFLGGYRSGEEITIKANINPAAESIAFNDLIVSSDSFEAKGKFIYSKDPRFQSSLVIDFSKCDINNWLNDADNNVTVETYQWSNVASKQLLSSGINAKISANQVKMDSNNTIDEFIFDTSLVGGRIIINDFKGKLGAKGKFTITGNVSQNEYRSLFNGKIEIIHDDLNDLFGLLYGQDSIAIKAMPGKLSSSLKISSVDFSVDDLLIETNDNKIEARISTKFIGNSPRINAKLQIQTIDLDDDNLPFLGRLQKFLKSLSTDMKKNEYLSKLTPIRATEAVSHYLISADKVIYNKNKYEKFSCNVMLAPDQLKVENILLHNGDDYIDAEISLDTKELIPDLMLKVNKGSWQIDFPNFTDLLSYRNNILEKYAVEKIKLSCDINFDKLYQDDFAIEDLKTTFYNTSTLLYIQKMSSKIFGGRLKSSGSILLEPLTINFVYGLNSAPLRQINKLLPKGLFDDSGAISASGMISSNGDQLNKLVYNLYTKSEIILRDSKINNFSIDDLIQKVNSEGYNSKNLSSDLKEAILLGENEITQAQGEIELVKGVFYLPQIDFATKYSNGKLDGKLNIYNFELDLNTIFSFLVEKKINERRTIKKQIALPLKASGSFLSPKKEPDPSELNLFIKGK